MVQIAQDGCNYTERETKKKSNTARESLREEAASTTQRKMALFDISNELIPTPTFSLSGSVIWGGCSTTAGSVSDAVVPSCACQLCSRENGEMKKRKSGLLFFFFF